MKFVRYRKDKPEYRGVLEGDKVRRINGTIFHDFSFTEDIESVEDIIFLPPILPQKVIGLRDNYGMDEGKTIPKFFMLPSSTIIGHGSNIIIPPGLDQVTVEVELAVVIGKKCRNIEARHADHYILGYTIANDITGLSHKFSEPFTQGKYYDTFTPMGQAIDTSCSPNNILLRTWVNGELRQEGNTQDMAFDVPFVVSYLSSFMTLEPGDVIITGTPTESVPIKPGDVIEMEIDRIGRLRNVAVGLDG